MNLKRKFQVDNQEKLKVSLINSKKKNNSKQQQLKKIKNNNKNKNKPNSNNNKKNLIKNPKASKIINLVFFNIQILN